VPDTKDLAPLPKAPLAKPLPVTIPLFARFKDLFENFTPSTAQSLASSSNSVCEADPEKRLESILQKSAKIKQNGGLAALETKLKELPLLFRRNEEIINEVE